jgi:methylated-DNA-[protein]-cysteine S-methyltransferase
VPKDAPDIADLLRSRGLRSTPQRRAILDAFGGGPTEHLSSEEVHARASQAMPDLGRGTVYATLAEFTELELLAAVGAPEPVRYETNVSHHDHFRCRLCLRFFDLDLDGPVAPQSREGFEIERIELRAEGVCIDCVDYEGGLDSGARAIRRRGGGGPTLERRGVAARELDGPLGPLLFAASAEGLLRVAFAEDSDAGALRELVARRRGGDAARTHLDCFEAELGRYFASEGNGEIECSIDWEAFAANTRSSLAAVREVPFGDRRSYLELAGELGPQDLGRAYGANPIPLAVPCHRVMRGYEVPESYVGGSERRRWLLAHEQGLAQRA